MKKLSLITILILIIILSSCNKKMVNANLTQNETEFSATYDLLNTELSHDMELKEGDRIAVSLVDGNGRLDVLVTDNKGEAIYKGNDADTGSFYLDITEGGSYTFSVTGTKAEGSFSFKIY